MKKDVFSIKVCDKLMEDLDTSIIMFIEGMDTRKVSHKTKQNLILEESLMDLHIFFTLVYDYAM